jgi:hypothetical protein
MKWWNNVWQRIELDDGYRRSLVEMAYRRVMYRSTSSPRSRTAR